MMKWPNKNDREIFEIGEFTAAYIRLPEGRQFEIVSKGEKPDYVVKESNSGEEYGIELTSAYLNDQSVPDIHIPNHEGIVDIPYDEKKIEQYLKRLIATIIEKVCKARKGYDCSRPLILAIYINEYIAIYLGKPELETFVQRYEYLFDSMAPFTEIVFWNLGNDGVFQVKPN